MTKLDKFVLHLSHMDLDMGKDVYVEAERDAVILKGTGMTVLIGCSDKGTPIAYFPYEGEVETVDVLDLPRFVARLAGCVEWWERVVSPKLSR